MTWWKPIRCEILGSRFDMLRLLHFITHVVQQWQKQSLSRVGRNCDPQVNDLKSQVNLQCFHCIHDQVTDRQNKVSAGSDLDGGHLTIDFGNSRLTLVWIKTSHELFRHWRWDIDLVWGRSDQMTDIISSPRLQSRLMFIVVSADGRVMANMTSGVDAHLIQKVTPGASTWKFRARISKAI